MASCSCCFFCLWDSLGYLGRSNRLRRRTGELGAVGLCSFQGKMVHTESGLFPWLPHCPFCARGATYGALHKTKQHFQMARKLIRSDFKGGLLSQRASNKPPAAACNCSICWHGQHVLHWPAARGLRGMRSAIVNISRVSGAGKPPLWPHGYNVNRGMTWLSNACYQGIDENGDLGV